MIKGSNKYERLAESLQGFYTIETLADRLKIERSKAIYVIHRLRNLGFVKTSYGSGKRRIYNISMANRQGGISYTERINEATSNPGIQVMPTEIHYVYGRVPSYEEALIYAIKQRNIRYIIASLALFKKISNWSLLYRLAKKEDLVREVVALYEIARKVVKKVRKMPKRFFNRANERKRGSFRYIIRPFSSEDFKDTERKWNVYIPLNSADLTEYRHT